VSEGTGALAEVTVRVKDLYSGRTFVGRGTHVDLVDASAEAYLDAVNSLLNARDAEEDKSASLRFPKAKVSA